MSTGAQGGSYGAGDEEMEDSELDRQAGQTMEGGIGILRRGAVPAVGNCRCPGFQIHDTKFESESTLQFLTGWVSSGKCQKCELLWSTKWFQ